MSQVITRLLTHSRDLFMMIILVLTSEKNMKPRTICASQRADPLCGSGA